MNSFFTGFGILGSASIAWVISVIASVSVALGFASAPLWIWMLAASALLFGLGAPTWAWALFVIVGLVFNIRGLRRYLITRPIMGAT